MYFSYTQVELKMHKQTNKKLFFFSPGSTGQKRKADEQVTVCIQLVVKI